MRRRGWELRGPSNFSNSCILRFWSADELELRRRTLSGSTADGRVLWNTQLVEMTAIPRNSFPVLMEHLEFSVWRTPCYSVRSN
jgi:hypothetical protein